MLSGPHQTRIASRRTAMMLVAAVVFAVALGSCSSTDNRPDALAAMRRLGHQSARVSSAIGINPGTPGGMVPFRFQQGSINFQTANAVFTSDPGALIAAPYNGMIVVDNQMYLPTSDVVAGIGVDGKALAGTLIEVPPSARIGLTTTLPPAAFLVDLPHNLEQWAGKQTDVSHKDANKLGRVGSQQLTGVGVQLDAKRVNQWKNKQVAALSQAEQTAVNAEFKAGVRWLPTGQIDVWLNKADRVARIVYRDEHKGQVTLIVFTMTSYGVVVTAAIPQDAKLATYAELQKVLGEIDDPIVPGSPGDSGTTIPSAPPGQGIPGDREPLPGEPVPPQKGDTGGTTTTPGPATTAGPSTSTTVVVQP